MSLINRTRLKEVCGEFNVGSDFVDLLDKEVEVIIKKSCKRAESNNRKTVMAKDL